MKAARPRSNARAAAILLAAASTAAAATTAQVAALPEASAQTAPATAVPPAPAPPLPPGPTPTGGPTTVAPSGPAAPPEVLVEAVPIINTGGTTPAIPWGWNEIVVRVQNTSGKPVRGEVRVSTEHLPDNRLSLATAPYSVGPGASAIVRVPAKVVPYADLSVQVDDEALGTLSSQRYTSTAQTSVILFDVSEPSRLRSAIHDAYVAPNFVLPGAHTHPSGTGMALLVGTPRIDPATGDAVLPDRAALYSGADAVLLRSETLTRLTGPELEALAGYALAGGTIAVVLTRPEDARHPTIASLVGGEPARAAVHPETLKIIGVPSPYGTSGPSKIIPAAAAPKPAVAETLTGWAGGNLRGSIYGASATYGLGEVHLLAFDPTRAPAVDDDWVKGRMIDLARRGYDRRSTLIFRPGSGDAQNVTRVRQQLDPNESSRWAIAAAALLLCVYAVIAGPLNFSSASKKGQPLRALRYLPIIAAAAFALIVGIGVAAKGVSGRARHLTLIEAGAGMTKATARRWRGFFTSSSKELTIRSSDALSMVSTAVLPDASDKREHLLIDRDGARLTEVAALPWQTIVIREDGFASLGDGIAIVKEGASDVAVVNRSGRRMRAAILWLPGTNVRYFDRIEDGAKVVSTAGVALDTAPDGRGWYSGVLSTRRAGSLDVHMLNAEALRRVIEKDAPGLTDAWRAIEDASDPMADWFPGDVPVLLGQLDGGEGKMSDSGLRLETDRLLVRVVGFGGKP